MNITQFGKIKPDSKVVLIFDVETNGLLDMRKIHSLKLEDSPYVLQMSYIMYDIAHDQMVKTLDTYVNVAESICISEETTKINGITREHCNKGMEMVDVLREFYKDYHMSDVCIAHNYRFDSTMLNIEFQRNWPIMCDYYPYALNLFHPAYMKHRKMRYKCTMFESIDICKLPIPPKPVKPTTENVEINSDVQSKPSCVEKVSESVKPTSTSPNSLSDPVQNSVQTSNINTTPKPQLMLDLPKPVISPKAESAVKVKPPLKPSYKWPTLSELYKHYYGRDPTGMHNSMMDVWVTLRCYLMMEKGKSFSEEEFDEYTAALRK